MARIFQKWKKNSEHYIKFYSSNLLKEQFSFDLRSPVTDGALKIFTSNTLKF